jgi:hypothetical protein
MTYTISNVGIGTSNQTSNVSLTVTQGVLSASSTSQIFQISKGVAPTIAAVTGNATAVFGSNVSVWGSNQFTQIHNDLAIIVDQKGSGTGGGNNNAGWNRRNINTIYANVGDNVVSVVSDQVWIKAGTYEANWSCPFYGGINRSKLRNASISTDIQFGITGSSTNSIMSTGQAVFSVASASNAIEVYYWSYAYVGSTSALGTPASSGDVEVYTTLSLRRIA